MGRAVGCRMRRFRRDRHLSVVQGLSGRALPVDELVVDARVHDPVGESLNDRHIDNPPLGAFCASRSAMARRRGRGQASPAVAGRTNTVVAQAITRSDNGGRA